MRAIRADKTRTAAFSLSLSLLDDYYALRLLYAADGDGMLVFILHVYIQYVIARRDFEKKNDFVRTSIVLFIIHQDLMADVFFFVCDRGLLTFIVFHSTLQHKRTVKAMVYAKKTAL